MERIASRAGVLLDGIITFWKGLRDDAFGGYYGYMSQGLELDKTAEKGCILNSRILWFFSEAAMLTGRQALREETVTCTSYYAASDTRLHVATTTVEKLLDYAFNTPADPLRSRDCVAQRCRLIDRNLEYLGK